MIQILRILGTLAALGILAVGLDAAQIQQGSNNYKCVAVNGGKTANGTAVIAYSCSGGPEDQWNYVFGQLQGIGSADGTYKCLDVKGQGTTAGTLVDLWSCTSHPNQQWEIEGGAIIGVQSQMCLDSSGGPKVGGGTQLVINTCTGVSSQNWTVRGMQLELQTSYPYLCANVQASQTANGTPILAYSCNGAPNELWNYKSDSHFYGLGTDRGNNKCLTSSGSTVGSVVTLSSCVSGDQEQTWTILNGTRFGFADTDLIVLSAGGGTLCLDSSGGPTVNGSPQLVVNTCTSANSQNWNAR